MPFKPEQLTFENLSGMAAKLAEYVDPELENGITQEEANARSLAALQALKDRLVNDASVIEHAKESGAEIPKNLIGWYEDFQNLLDAGWPWRVATYIAWQASPKANRYPKTQEALAVNVLGLTSDRAISKWRKNNPCIDETIAIMQAAPLLSHRRDVFTALIESAADPSFHGSQDRKTVLTMTGDYVPHQKVELEKKPGSPVEMSDAELDEEIRRLEAKNGNGN